LYSILHLLPSFVYAIDNACMTRHVEVLHVKNRPAAVHNDQAFVWSGR